MHTNPMITLGIETSCDETALAIIETRNNNGTFECRIISSLVHSQAELHSSFGGVFPTLAKREHGRNLLPLLKKLLEEFAKSTVIGDKTEGATVDEVIDTNTIKDADEAQVNGARMKSMSDMNFDTALDKFRNELTKQNPDLMESFAGTNAQFLKNIPHIDCIAVTEGPGLEPALWVGIIFGQILSKLWSIPLIPVNHMEGHIVGSLLESDRPDGTWQKLKPLEFPAIALLISGGHTELVKVDSLARFNLTNLDYTIIGQTKDDAVGEAFDKVARLLGLPYPGGPHVSKLAKEAEEAGIASEIKLPRPMLHSGDLDFSFSGLKTAVMYAVRDYENVHGSLDDNFKKGLCREFESAVKESLDAKLRSAIESVNAKTIIIGGGVSANRTLRETFTKTAQEYDLPLYLPSQHVSGDNALMIALAGALDDEVYDRKLKAQGTKRLG